MMILSKPLRLILSLLFSSVLPGRAANDNALRSLVDSENNFAHTSVERGIRDSFLKFFADDSIIFAPAPTNGKKFYTKYVDKGRRLMWQPIFATISNAGDLGTTTGPWEMQKSASEKTPIAFGDFLSVWKKQRDNSWKVIVDVGIDHGKPSDAPGDIQLLPPAEPAAKIDLKLAQGGLDKAEETLVDTLKEGAGSAIVASASKDIHVLRENSFPAVGQEAARVMLTSDNAKMTRTKSGGGMSKTADLAYRYGSYSSELPNATERGYFLTVWRAERADDWKIIVDLQKKEPDKKP
jgi:ketosteroid isomerase-like protein